MFPYSTFFSAYIHPMFEVLTKIYIIMNNTLQVSKYSFRKGIGLISGFAIACLTLFSIQTSQAQTSPEIKSAISQTTTSNSTIDVQGKVIVDGVPLLGANIILEGSAIGTTTDMDGNFIFPKKLKKGDVLIISYVGMEPEKIRITDQHSAANVALNVSMTEMPIVVVADGTTKKIYRSKPIQ